MYTDAKHDFTQVVAATLEATQLIANPDSARDISHDEIQGVALRTPDDTADILMTEHRGGWMFDPSQLETDVDQRPYNLRGLLPYKAGVIAIDGEYLGVSLGRQHTVQVNVIPSPYGYNTAIASLGREPGKNAPSPPSREKAIYGHETGLYIIVS